MSAISRPAASATPRTPTQRPSAQDLESQPPPHQPDPGRQPTEIGAALRHALTIATASTPDELVERTLAAARALTRARVAVASASAGTTANAGTTASAGTTANTGTSEAAGTTANAGAGATADAGAAAGTTEAGIPAVSAMLGQTRIVVAGPDLADDAAALLDLIVTHARATAEHLDEVSRLTRHANSDPLTGLCHRRPFEQRLASSDPGHTAIIAVDVDYFKEINDTHGHQAGNRALLALVAAMRSALRERDELFRIGGDEFAVIAEVGRRSEVRVITRRLLEAARRAGHSISVGAAVRAPDEPAAETLRRADQALYEAKRAGRDTARLAA